MNFVTKNKTLRYKTTKYMTLGSTSSDGETITCVLAGREQSEMALSGIKVVEMAGLVPVPLCGMILADFGAKVIRVDKITPSPTPDHLARGKRSIAVDLKSKEGVAVVNRLCDNADVLIEPFRTGVMEKLGLGPDKLLTSNPKLIYARLTGFGQSGAYAKMAGHDINYLAVSGVLSALGRKESNPHPPINLLADMAGGGLSCAMGIMMALYERTSSKKGQVIDANMVEGAAYLSNWLWRSRSMWIWGRGRGENWLDGGAHFYETYKTKDDKYMAVGAIEPQFYKALLKGLQLTEEEAPQITDDNNKIKKKFAAVFATKTQSEWCEIFDQTDGCVTPVLSLDEAPNHPHNLARKSFLHNSETKSMEPIPAPILSRTPGVPHVNAQPALGQHTREVLLENGFSDNQIRQLESSHAIKCNDAIKSNL